MEHSIAAKYAARPAAHFVRPSSRDRERRLGLRTAATFHAVTARPTVLRRADLSPLVQLRANWRAIRPARIRRVPSGHLKPVVTMRWSRPSGPVRQGRSGAASAPWLA